MNKKRKEKEYNKYWWEINERKYKKSCWEKTLEEERKLSIYNIWKSCCEEVK